jgi:hypothetical protein
MYSDGTTKSAGTTTLSDQRTKLEEIARTTDNPLEIIKAAEQYISSGKNVQLRKKHKKTVARKKMAKKSRKRNRK